MTAFELLQALDELARKCEENERALAASDIRPKSLSMAFWRRNASDLDFLHTSIQKHLEAM